MKKLNNSNSNNSGDNNPGVNDKNSKNNKLRGFFKRLFAKSLFRREDGDALMYNDQIKKITEFNGSEIKVVKAGKTNAVPNISMIDLEKQIQTEMNQKKKPKIFKILLFAIFFVLVFVVLIVVIINI